MAQSKSSPSGKSGRPAGGSSRPGGKPGAARSGAGKSGTKTPLSKTATKAPAGPPPRKKKPKSIVNQKQTPWGLIITTVVVVLFAVGVVAVVIATKKDGGDDGKTSATNGGQSVKASDPYRQPELAAAAKIPGVTYRVEAQHNHELGHIKYDSTPPIGGNHNAYWADCSGTVYDKPIANENATHMLEHGAVWITYNADEIKGAQLTALKKYVAGQDRMALSPYPDLKTPISLQSWGYQLKVSKATDPRIAQFIAALKYNQKVTPEYGATCSQPTFKENPSSFGNPKDGP